MKYAACGMLVCVIFLFAGDAPGAEVRTWTDNTGTYTMEAEMVHYVDLNKNVMPNNLPFTELLKRAEETSKKIESIE